MRKIPVVGIFVITFLGCIKNNSTTPISGVQLAMNGKWQVDSVRTMNKDAIIADSIYANHFVEITSEGNKVNITMSPADVMTYTISGYSLTPYSGQSRGGCGTPIAPTKVSVSSNKLQLITDQGLVTTVYMHK